MDPVGPNVHRVPVGEAVLVEATSYPVAALEYCHLEAVLEEDISAAEAGEPGAYDSDMWN